MAVEGAPTRPKRDCMAKVLTLGALVIIAFLTLNHPWTHAAMASVVGGMERCPSALSEKARARVGALLGPVRSSPLILCQARPGLGLDVPYGTTRFAPLLPSIVVVGPFGRNLDVLSHEWAHAELASRTGVLLRMYRVPVWFDEGLAMQLDQRPDYSEVALKRYRAAGLFSGVTLARLARPEQFFHDGDLGKSHYALARCVVGRWLHTAHPRMDLLAFLQNISWWRAFPDHNFEVEASACLSGPEPERSAA